jgi:hypothetical protein
VRAERGTVVVQAGDIVLATAVRTIRRQGAARPDLVGGRRDGKKSK